MGQILSAVVISEKILVNGAHGQERGFKPRYTYHAIVTELY
jgi:hypothetical protein